MKTHQSLRNISAGFTIVELLIVIIVIGILATITVLGYQGTITNSKSQAAQTSAASLQKKLESYYAATGSYPTATSAAAYTTQLNSINESSISATGISIVGPTTSLSVSNGQKTVAVSYCISPAAVAAATAYQISYFDYKTNQPSTTMFTATVANGNCTSWKALT